MGMDSSVDLLFLDVVLHDWLLPRCKTIVHHGSAGTTATAAGLCAGIPSVVIPFAGDQLFWGKRVHAIGRGTAADFCPRVDGDVSFIRDCRGG
jgi:UDP:flavonoid glycosyltransferase YjiC (YdhE family)